jgi:predicted transcriptional regulator
MGKATDIGLRTKKYSLWSKQELTLLKKLYPDNSTRDIANELGRTVSAVQKKAGKLGLRKSIRVWSKRELNLLKKLYPSRMAQQIADQIGRPVQATRKRIVKLGLKKRLRLEDRHRVVKGVKEKLCSKCGKWKDDSQFSKDRSSKDGLVVWCKECLSAARKKRWLAMKN